MTRTVRDDPAQGERSTGDLRSGDDASGIDSPVLQLAPLAGFAIDMSGRIHAWNAAAERLFGWEASEVIGELVPFLPAGEVSNAVNDLRGLLAESPQAEIELSPVRKDGTMIRVITSASLIGAEVPHGDANEQPLILGFAVDVTDRETNKSEITDAEYRWRKLLERISDTVTVLDRHGQVKDSTGLFAGVLTDRVESWKGLVDLLHPADRDAAVERWHAVLDDPRVESRDVFRTRSADGHYELIEYSAANLLDDPAIEGMVITTRNVTAVKQAEELLADEADLLELIAQDAPPEETLPAICRMVEHHSEGSSGILLLARNRHHVIAGAPGSIPPDIVREIERSSLDSASGPCAASMELREPVVLSSFGPDNTYADELELLRAHGIESGWASPIVENHRNEVLGTILVYHEQARDPTSHEREVVAVASHLASIAIDRSRAQRELFYQARHHQLTGLPNRTSIIEMLDGALRRAHTNHSKLAVMFVDLDRFKVVNDSLGHAAGDKLLVRFGARLKNLVRPTDYVGHFGADEFVVVLEDIADVEDVRFVSNRLDLALSEPFSIEEGEIFLSASVGVAVSYGGQDASDTLLQHADAAMYQAKSLGRDRLEVFDHEMRIRATAQLRLDSELRQAVERSELGLHYQPVIDLVTGRISGVEALLRWHHPDRGLVMPADFIPVAEDTGLIVRIGRWVLEEAVLQARRWMDRLGNLDGFSVAVNLSARQITSSDLIHTVELMLERYDWPPNQLVLELTESILIDDAEATLQVLRELKALGVKLAIDDFGTGFSSLSYLHRFPVDIVKVDRTFVTAIRGDGEGSPVAAAVMHMSRALDLVTSAEGVEESKQLAGLRALGCDMAQGYLFARPLASEQVEELLRSSPAW